MKNLILLLSVLMTSAAFARNLHQSECVGPAGAPVKAIYLHGWFPQSGNGTWYHTLEADNRKKLEGLAKKLNIRIAIPVARSINGANGMRQWGGGSLAAAEKQSKDACGSALAVPRALIGFSSGGYMARSVALQCDSKMKSSYSDIVMIGANAAAPPKGTYSGCPKFSVMVGKGDGTNRPDAIKSMLKSYKAKGGGDTGYVTFPGGHQIPSADLLAKQLQGLGQAAAVEAPAASGTGVNGRQ